MVRTVLATQRKVGPITTHRVRAPRPIDTFKIYHMAHAAKVCACLQCSLRLTGC
jgi:hypothetical protein